MTENPLEFLDEFSNEIDIAAARVNEFSMLLPAAASVPATTSGVDNNNKNGNPPQTGPTTIGVPIATTGKTTLARLNKVCRRDMSFLTPAVNDLKKQVDRIRTNIHKLSDAVSCGQISPLLRRISHGAVCVESPRGMTVLWSTAFGIGVLCFVLLTLRAALYNSVKYKKRRPTKPRRIVEKEFEEYKEYMGKYYGEDTTKEWNIDGDPLPPTKLEFEFDKDIEMKGTFDTARSTKGSEDDSHESDGSENAGIFDGENASEDESSYGSSYDSEISDDSNSSDSSGNGDDLSSAFGSFLSETKSIALHTLHSLRNIKSLLSGSQTNNPPSHIGESDLDWDEINLEENEDEDKIHYGDGIFFSRTVETVSTKDKDKENYDENNDDDESQVNSISDDSMYLPTPKGMTKNNVVQIASKNKLGCRVFI